jgi:hypothetical protein
VQASGVLCGIACRAAPRRAIDHTVRATHAGTGCDGDARRRSTHRPQPASRRMPGRLPGGDRAPRPNRPRGQPSGAPSQSRQRHECVPNRHHTLRDAAFMRGAIHGGRAAVSS